MRPQSEFAPARPTPVNFFSASAKAASYSVWYSFSGVSRSGSRRAQKIFLNSSRSPLSLSSRKVFSSSGSMIGRMWSIHSLSCLSSFCARADRGASRTSRAVASERRMKGIVCTPWLRKIRVYKRKRGGDNRGTETAGVSPARPEWASGWAPERPRRAGGSRSDVPCAPPRRRRCTRSRRGRPARTSSSRTALPPELTRVLPSSTPICSSAGGVSAVFTNSTCRRGSTRTASATSRCVFAFASAASGGAAGGACRAAAESTTAASHIGAV